MFKTLVCLEHWHIQKHRHIQNPVKHVIVKSYNYFCNIIFSRSLLYEINIMNSFNAGLIFTPEVFIPCKKVWEPRGPGVVNFNIPSVIQLFIKLKVSA